MLTVKNERNNTKKRVGIRSLLTRRISTVAMTLSLMVALGASTTVTAFEETITKDSGIPEQIVVSTVIPLEGEESEYNDKISEELKTQELLEQQAIEEIRKEERLAYINSIVCDPNNITRTTGLKEEDYKLLTKGTWWEGNEQALIDLEKTYGVNAMFAMAVSTLESGYGTSSRAKTRNNYYGLELKKSWNGLYSNTQYWGNVIAKYYVGCGRSSASSISTKYCPPNSSNWASFVSSQMNKYYSELITKLGSTEN